MMVREGLQFLLSKQVNGSLEFGSVAFENGNSRKTNYFFSFASSRFSAQRRGGTLTWKRQFTYPVSMFSSLSSKVRAILKQLGTTPEVSPLCRAIYRTSTRRVATRLPRREFVSQSRSQSRVPESRQKNEEGSPILSLRVARQWAMWQLPLSQSPSVIMTHLGNWRPWTCKALIASMVEKVAYPSSAPPRPQSLPSSITGVQGARPQRHPFMGGCLSKCPQKKIVWGRVPLTSVKIRGEQPQSWTISQVIPQIFSALTQSTICWAARWWTGLVFQRGSNARD